MKKRFCLLLYLSKYLPILILGVFLWFCLVIHGVLLGMAVGSALVMNKEEAGFLDIYPGYVSDWRTSPQELPRKGEGEALGGERFFREGAVSVDGYWVHFIQERVSATGEIRMHSGHLSYDFDHWEKLFFVGGISFLLISALWCAAVDRYSNPKSTHVSRNRETQCALPHS